jgi:hypothetical protein
VVTRAAPAGAVASLVQRRDDAPVVEARLSWAPGPGGWYLREKTLAVYDDGRLAGRYRTTVSVGDVTRRTGVRGMLVRLTDVLRTPAPDVLAAQSTDCLREWSGLIAAARALAGARAAVSVTPSDPTRWDAYGNAADVWSAGADGVLRCAAIRTPQRRSSEGSWR